MDFFLNYESILQVFNSDIHIYEYMYVFVITNEAKGN